MTDPLADTTRMIDNWERDASQKAARFQHMAEQVEQVSITESVAGGAVSVTVGRNGIPTDVRMTEAVTRMAAEEIAANVMAAMRKAQSRYPARLAEIVAETVGEEDPAGQHIVATAERSFPSPEEEEQRDDPLVDDIRFTDEDEEPRPPRPPSQPPPSRRPRPADDGEEDGRKSIFED